MSDAMDPSTYQPQQPEPEKRVEVDWDAVAIIVLITSIAIGVVSIVFMSKYFDNRNREHEVRMKELEVQMEEMKHPDQFKGWIDPKGQ